MPVKIHSTIEVIRDGCTMPHRKRKHKQVSDNPNADQVKPHSHHYKSEVHTDKNRFFHHIKNANAGVNQTVNVDVKVEQEKGCMAEMFEGLAKLFRP